MYHFHYFSCVAKSYRTVFESKDFITGQPRCDTSCAAAFSRCDAIIHPNKRLVDYSVLLSRCGFVGFYLTYINKQIKFN